MGRANSVQPASYNESRNKTYYKERVFLLRACNKEVSMILAIKCSLCGNWMPALKTKKGRPFLYCGHCRYGFMILAKVGMDAFNNACQEINESDLIPETRKKYQELTYEEETKK